MKYFLTISVLLLPTLASTQDVEPDHLSECAAVLASPPANELAEQSMEGNFGSMGKSLRQVLLGKTCSVEQITEYMLLANWKLGQRGITTPDIPVSDSRHTYDTKINLCFPERGFWRILNECRGFGSISLLEGKITWVSFAASIRFGG